MAKHGFGNSGKSGGFKGNMVKLGGSGKKLDLKSYMKSDSFNVASRKKGAKQAHKKA